MESPRILIVDPDTARRAEVHDGLSRGGHESIGAPSWPEALDLARRKAVAVVVVDSRVPGLPASTAALLRDLAEVRRGSVAVLTGFEPGPVTAPGEAVPTNLADMLPSEAGVPAVVAAVRMAVRHRALVEELASLRERLRAREGYDRLVGRSPAMEALRDRIARIAAEGGPALFHGEDGTGRTLAARSLHAASASAAGPFVVVHAPAFAEDRIDAELFGGDAEGGTVGGALAAAAGGTLMIVEVSALPLDVQRRLAWTFAADGGRAPVGLAVSTALDPRRAVEDGRLDERLGEAFGGRVVRVPPLRERTDDIALLARHFLDTIAEINRLPPIRPTAETLAILAGYTWPSNVRELRNALEHAAILCADGVVAPEDLPDGILRGAAPGRGTPMPAREAGGFRDAKRRVVGEFERRYLTDLMARNAGNVTAAAAEARMLRSALQRLLRKHHLRSAEFRKGRRGPSADATPS